MAHDREVSVTLLLNGGHSRTLYLQRKDPLLAALVSSIDEKSFGGGRPARAFNIRINQGRRSFIFSSTDLVALVTDPPLMREEGPRRAVDASPQPDETEAMMSVVAAQSDIELEQSAAE